MLSYIKTSQLPLQAHHSVAPSYEYQGTTGQVAVPIAELSSFATRFFPMSSRPGWGSFRPPQLEPFRQSPCDSFQCIPRQTGDQWTRTRPAGWVNFADVSKTSGTKTEARRSFYIFSHTVSHNKVSAIPSQKLPCMGSG